MDITARSLVAERGTFRLEVSSFRANAGGTVILGPNGAGKTTLLLALQGLIPCSGSVERPSRCAAVFARPAVLRGTVLANVAVVVAGVLSVPASEAATRARDVLGEVGLVEALHAEARTLSTGQRQRLALARALATFPGALFLDEPFANVDADGRPALRELVRTYVRASGCALVLATSSLADAVSLCASATVLHRGSVAMSGSVGDLSVCSDPYIAALLEESSVRL